MRIPILFGFAGRGRVGLPPRDFLHMSFGREAVQRGGCESAPALEVGLHPSRGVVLGFASWSHVCRVPTKSLHDPYAYFPHDSLPINDHVDGANPKLRFTPSAGGSPTRNSNPSTRPCSIDDPLSDSQSCITSADSSDRLTNGQSTVAVTILQLFERGHLRDARCAPRGPDVEQERAFLELRESPSASLDVREPGTEDRGP